MSKYTPTTNNTSTNNLEDRTMFSYTEFPLNRCGEIRANWLRMPRIQGAPFYAQHITSASAARAIIKDMAIKPSTLILDKGIHVWPGVQPNLACVTSMSETAALGADDKNNYLEFIEYFGLEDLRYSGGTDDIMSTFGGQGIALTLLIDPMKSDIRQDPTNYAHGYSNWVATCDEPMKIKEIIKIEGDLEPKKELFWSKVDHDGSCGDWVLWYSDWKTWMDAVRIANENDENGYTNNWTGYQTKYPRVTCGDEAFNDKD